VSALRPYRSLLLATLAYTLITLTAVLFVAERGGTSHVSAFTTRVVDRALGSQQTSTPLTRTPAQGLKVEIQTHGFTYDAGPDGTVGLAAVDLGSDQRHSFANGTLRYLSFGSEAVTVNGGKAEEYLTIGRKLGTHTWRWRLDTSLEARVSDRGWVGFFDRRSNRLMSVAMLPVKIFDAEGHDVTPAKLKWQLQVVKGRQYLTLTLDDAKLPLPYTIDPGAYRTNNTASSTAASGTFTVTMPATVNAKDLLLVHEAGKATTATSTFPTTPTDNTSGGNTWATVSGTNVANTTVDQFVWWKWAISGDASSTVTVTIPGSTSPSITTAVVDVYKGLDSTKNGPQTTGATNTSTNRKFNTPAITASGATTQEHMIMMVGGNFNTSTAWPATVNATGGTWAVQPSGTNAGGATSESMATYDADTNANSAYLATASANVWGASTNSVASAFGFSDDIANPTNGISITNLSGNAYLAGSPVTGSTGTLYYNNGAGGSFQLQNAVSDGESGPAQSTFPALVGGTNWSHTAATVTTPTGGPYNSGASPNNFSWTTSSSGSPTEAMVGSDNAGNTATTTLTFTLDTSATAPAITLPVGSTHYSSGGWSTITGTASDGGSGVGSDQVSIQDTTVGGSSCWKPSTSDFTAACPNYITATGTTSWTYSGIASTNLTDGHNYTATARTTDNVNNTSSTTSASFTYDNSAPTASITSPTNNTHYNSPGWGGSLAGSASDATSSVATV
jgi:hypothetical protein